MMHLMSVDQMSRRCGMAIFLVVLGISLSLTGLGNAAAGPVTAKVTISGLYNDTQAAFYSLEAVASQHNRFIAHRSQCAGEKSKSWMRTARADMHAVQGVLSALKHMPRAAQKLEAYRDLMAAQKKLSVWAQRQVLARLGTCKRAPTGDAGVQKAILKVDQDLGHSTGY